MHCANDLNQNINMTIENKRKKDDLKEILLRVKYQFTLEKITRLFGTNFSNLVLKKKKLLLVF